MICPAATIVKIVIAQLLIAAGARRREPHGLPHDGLQAAQQRWRILNGAESLKDVGNGAWR